MLATLANCVHKGTVDSVRPVNIYSDSDKKIQGNSINFNLDCVLFDNAGDDERCNIFF